MAILGFVGSSNCSWTLRYFGPVPLSLFGYVLLFQTLYMVLPLSSIRHVIYCALPLPPAYNFDTHGRTKGLFRLQNAFFTLRALPGVS